MKVKTSITLSDYILAELDTNLDKSGNRSEFIEKAVKVYLDILRRAKRNKRDLNILNKYANYLNKEALDVLSYQVNI